MGDSQTVFRLRLNHSGSHWGVLHPLPAGVFQPKCPSRLLTLILHHRQPLKKYSPLCTSFSWVHRSAIFLGRGLLIFFAHSRWGLDPVTPSYLGSIMTTTKRRSKRHTMIAKVTQRTSSSMAWELQVGLSAMKKCLMKTNGSMSTVTTLYVPRLSRAVVEWT